MAMEFHDLISHLWDKTNGFVIGGIKNYILRSVLQKKSCQKWPNSVHYWSKNKMLRWDMKLIFIVFDFICKIYPETPIKKTSVSKTPKNKWKDIWCNGPLGDLTQHEFFICFCFFVLGLQTNFLSYSRTFLQDKSIAMKS